MVILSTTEAEFIAITEVSKEAKWIKDLVGGLARFIFCDSKSVIHLLKNQNMFY